MYYNKLTKKLSFQRVIYNELREKYYKIEGELKRKKNLEDKVFNLSKAKKQLEFHIKRNKQLLCDISKDSEFIRNQENIIKNLEKELFIIKKENKSIKNKEINFKFSQEKNKNNFLKVKLDKIKYTKELNDDILPYKFIEEIRDEILTEDDKVEISLLKDRGNLLLNEIKSLTNQNNNFDIINNVNDFLEDKIDIEPNSIKIKDKEIEKSFYNKIEYLENEILKINKKYNKEISELKLKISVVDDQLN